MSPVTNGIMLSLDRIKPIPAVVLKVLALTKDPATSVKDIVKVIKLDETLTFKVLRLANSVYFNRQQKTISSVDEAVVRLGTNTLVNILIAEACSGSFRNTGEGYDLKRGELWKHSVACALASQKLAELTKFKDKDLLFTACILHDVGKTVLDAFVNKKKTEIIQNLYEKNLPFTESEIQALGFSHSEIGAKILEKWQFPDEIIEAVRHHHDPSKAERHIDLVYHVYMCDVMCLMMGVGLGLDGLFYSYQSEAFSRYGLSDIDIQMMFVYLVEQTAKAEEWLNL